MTTDVTLEARDRHQAAVDADNGRGWFCLAGAASGQLLTLQGRLLVHHDRHELAYLIPGHKVLAVPPSASRGPFLPISAHPDLSHIQQWDPINTKEFRP